MCVSNKKGNITIIKNVSTYFSSIYLYHCSINIYNCVNNPIYAYYLNNLKCRIPKCICMPAVLTFQDNNYTFDFNRRLSGDKHHRLTGFVCCRD